LDLLNKMNDTTTDGIRHQLSVFLSKTESERFRIGDELNEFGRSILIQSIREEYPLIHDSDLQIEIFHRIYSSYFSEDEMNRIILSLKEYLKTQ